MTANPLAGLVTTATELPIALVRRDGGTQPRAVIDQASVAAYVEDMRDGRWRWDRDLPVVFYDGSAYWLADGFHRCAAAELAGMDRLPFDVRQGDRRAAVLHSVGANANHGLRRSNEDKRRAVTTLLTDPEWSQWSDREIARRCAVSHEMVNNIRPSLSESDSDNRLYTSRQGTQASMNTTNIGARPASGPNPQAIETVRTWLVQHVSAGQRTYALRNWNTPPWNRTLKPYTEGLESGQVRSAVNWLIANPDQMAFNAPPAPPTDPKPERPAPILAPSRNGHGDHSPTPARAKPREYGDDEAPRLMTGSRFVTLDAAELDSLANVAEGQCIEVVSLDETGRLLVALRNGFVLQFAAVTEQGRPALAWRIT